MGMKEILIVRALVWLIVGVALFVSLMYQLPEERKSSKAEKKARIIIVSVIGIILIGTGIADIVFAISPNLETRNLELTGMSKKRLFETSCTFEDESEVYPLDVPADVAKASLKDLLTEGTWYTVTFETRSNVVVEIHELE